jgi:hypothetical protein
VVRRFNCVIEPMTLANMRERRAAELAGARPR